MLSRCLSAYYGWRVLAAAVLSIATINGLSFWSFGLFIDPLEEEFGWSRATLSLGLSLGLLISGLLSPLIGRAIDHFGPRRVIMIGSTLTGATYLLLASTDNLWQWYLYLIINAAARQMIFIIPFQALISRWFERRRPFAMGLLAMGFFLGGSAVVPIMRVVMDTVEWRGAFIVSGIWLTSVFLLLSLLVIRNQPADVGAFVDGDPPAPGRRSTEPTQRGLPLSAAIRTPLFWLYTIALTLLIYGIVGWIVHAVPYYESLDYSPGWAAALVAISAAGGIVSAPVLGYIAGRIISVDKTVLLVPIFLAIAMLTLFVSGGSVLGVAFFLPFLIAGLGWSPVLEAVLFPRAFGVAHFATLMGVVTLIETVGYVGSPTITGWIFDATGSYDIALLMFLGTFAAAIPLLLLAARLPHPTIPEPAPPLPAAVAPAPAPARSLPGGGSS